MQLSPPDYIPELRTAGLLPRCTEVTPYLHRMRMEASLLGQTKVNKPGVQHSFGAHVQGV